MPFQSCFLVSDETRALLSSASKDR
jgi:hypothetical protein